MRVCVCVCVLGRVCRDNLIEILSYGICINLYFLRFAGWMTDLPNGSGTSTIAQDTLS